MRVRFGEMISQNRRREENLIVRMKVRLSRGKHREASWQTVPGLGWQSQLWAEVSAVGLSISKKVVNRGGMLI